MFRRGGKLNVLSGKDDRIKIINERINLTEKHFGELCHGFKSLAQRLAKQRDTYDELAKCFKAYADEEISESLQEGLRSYCNAITIIGDYIDIKVHRLEAKLVNELSQYENLAKNVRDNLRFAIAARDKEILKQRQMLDIKTKFVANNSGADSELLKAKLEVNRANKEIDELSINFEQRKLQNMKSILHDFLLISMKYHTKALELLSATFYDVSNIDEKSDLDDFSNILRVKQEQCNKLSTLKLDLLRSQSMESLDRPQLLTPLQRSSKLSKSKPNLKSENSDEEPEEEEDTEEEETDEEAEDKNESLTSTESEESVKLSLSSKNYFKTSSKVKDEGKATKNASKT